jgi:amidase
MISVSFYAWVCYKLILNANVGVLNNMCGTDSPSGWSPRGGQTKSAYGPGLPIGGSSTGSGVGLAAGFCSASIGCETDGSIVSHDRFHTASIAKLLTMP